MGLYRGSQDDPATEDIKFQRLKKDDHPRKIEIKKNFFREKNNSNEIA